MRSSPELVCLDPEELTSYLAGAAQAAGKVRVECHLSTCGSCFDVFIDLFNRQLDRKEEEGLEVPS